MNSKSIAVIYDRPLDVLHIAVGKPTLYLGNGYARGVEIDFDLSTGTACGAKVIGFRGNGWDTDVNSLARFVALLLSANNRDILFAIQRAI